MTKKYQYDYYQIVLPSDLADSIHDLSNHAINEARENARLYCVPCEWESKLIRGNLDSFEVTFQVRRKRNVQR